jgi:hypothetical protein
MEKAHNRFTRADSVSPISPSSFLKKAFWKYSKALTRKLLRGILSKSPGGVFQSRSPESVRSLYDGHRARLLDQIPSLSWEDMVYGNLIYGKGDHGLQFVLVNDRIEWASVRKTRAIALTRIEKAVEAYVPSKGVAVEFGSGDGRNLIYLKRRFPDRTFIGLELSAVSVELARQLAAKFDLDVRFYQSNVCEGLPPELTAQSADLVFSCHALEQMPRIFTQAVENMLSVSKKAVVMLEPVLELWPLNRRGFVSRLRCWHIDYLRGLLPTIRKLTASSPWSIQSALRLKSANNPFNETCEIHVIADSSLSNSTITSQVEGARNA